jgi:hypothetical protein
MGSRGQHAHRGPTAGSIQSCCVAIGSDLSELIHHSDRGSQYLSLTYTDRLAELGIAPSVGSRGDSYETTPSPAPHTPRASQPRPWQPTSTTVVDRGLRRVCAGRGGQRVMISGCENKEDHGADRCGQHRSRPLAR